MAKITERENFWRMMNREEPAFVSHQPSLFQTIMPDIGDRAPGHGTGVDAWGVKWVADQNIKGTVMAEPGAAPVLEDICDWEDVVKFPDLSKVDWEGLSAKFEKDPTKIVNCMLVSGPFERLHDLMGFEEALIAPMMDPEATGAFFDAMADWKIECMTYVKKYFDADLIHYQDDYGNQKDLFMNPELWRELLKEPLKKAIDACHDLGMVFDMHSCGKIDRIFPDMMELGIDLINPAQPINDLRHWKEEYGGKVIFEGCIDAQNIIDQPSTTDEEIWNEVVSKIDLLASDGSYFIPFTVSLSPRATTALDYAYIYGRTFYSDEYADDAEAYRKAMENKVLEEWSFKEAMND